MRKIFTGNSVINQFIQVIPITLLVGNLLMYIPMGYCYHYV